MTTEAKFHQAIAPHLSKKQQGIVMGAFRAAVGGEAVAWRMMRANGKPYTGWKDLPVPEWASINVDDGMRLEYAYASPTATVDVGALRELQRYEITIPDGEVVPLPKGNWIRYDELAALIGKEA